MKTQAYDELEATLHKHGCAIIYSPQANKYKVGIPCKDGFPDIIAEDENFEIAVEKALEKLNDAQR